jgi:hypothetical protein
MLSLTESTENTEESLTEESLTEESLTENTESTEEVANGNRKGCATSISVVSVPSMRDIFPWFPCFP